MNRRRLAALIGGLTGLLLSVQAIPVAAQNDSYPDHPIHFVVGFSPGGDTDIVARVLARKITEKTGQSIVVDNRPGAGGAIASQYVAQAKPDGYTILFASSSFTIAPNFQTLQFDPVKSFTPITQATAAPLLLVVNPKLPVHSVQELIAMATKEPGKLSYASAGVGSGLQIAGELFKSMAHVNIQHIPFKGAENITSVIAGVVPISFAGIPQTIQAVKGGQLRALAVTSATRSPTLPDVPTIAESGVPGYDMSSWYGVLAPAGTPQARVDRLYGELKTALADPEVKKQLANVGQEARATSPQEFATYIQSELKKWHDLVQSAGISH
ncbi:Bug family tripartite tricarboxylate transporter substrate binding protein [Paraburkholderia sp. ZP32-5]|uniref:Bug family tripartite tricarboxylate transporter substrate binding protein n=1 Tax=Paraburkholderia sp. ZP32-5 TaxID=2883245 RepID=UPI001F454933|nr:tripartite tricarboxylate transporter substrate binding protein [Paraburkholderia sp. ZP32-5]